MINNKTNSEEQIENLKTISNELTKHSPLIRELLITSKKHEKNMFNREIFFGLSIILAVGVLTFFGKLNGETLAGLIGVIIGYIGAKNF